MNDLEKHTTIVIPAFNEEQGLPAVLKELYGIRDDLPETKEDCTSVDCCRTRTRLQELIEELEAAYTRRT